MRAMIVVVVIAALVIAVTVQVSKMYKAKGDLETRVEHYLDMVDEKSIESVKNELVGEAKKFEIDLVPGNINIQYEDTDQRTVAQHMVGNRLGAQFNNKRITIVVQYRARILGWPVGQEITAARIRQVAAPTTPPSKAVQELLDSQP